LSHVFLSPVESQLFILLRAYSCLIFSSVFLPSLFLLHSNPQPSQQLIEDSRVRLINDTVRIQRAMASGPDVHEASPTRHLKKTSLLSTFIHRRQHSSPEDLAPRLPGDVYRQYHDRPSPVLDDTMAVGQFVKNNPGALGELQQNSQESAPRSPQKSRDDARSDHNRGRSRSPTKSAIANVSLKLGGIKDATKPPISRETSPTKPAKVKSSTNLVSLLSRPKSLRSLHKLVTDDEIRSLKDKENQTPVEAQAQGLELPPPIFAQFTSGSSVRQSRDSPTSFEAKRDMFERSDAPLTRPVIKARPKSFQIPPRPTQDQTNPFLSSKAALVNGAPVERSSSGGQEDNRSRRAKVFSALTSRSHGRSKSVAAPPVVSSGEPPLDPKDIDRHLEAMLDRRNIPENQRYKMRNLNNTIKTEFIRQDWAEMQAAKAERSGTNDSAKSNGNTDPNSAIADGSDCEDVKQKKSRGKSFTFSRGKKGSGSPTKKPKGDGTLGRHFRSKSTESVASERPSSSGSTGPGLLAKIKLHQGPGDYVSYLRKVQRPESVEVGKLHKLRLLLRNETVSWIEEFIQQGGMKEIVGLLNRIMEVEWR
jgi:hypothetical protein